MASFQIFSGFFKVLFCFMLLNGLSSIGKDPMPQTGVRKELRPLVSYRQYSNDEESGGGTTLVLAGHLGDNELLWESIIWGNGYIEVGSIELTQTYLVVTLLYKGEVDLEGLYSSESNRLGALYIIYDLKGQLLVVGNLEGDEDITQIGVHLDPSGLTLTAQFSGVQVILPIPEPGETRNESVTYHFTSFHYGYRILHFSQSRMNGVMDLFREPPQYIAETGSSDDDPDGDPTNPPPSSGGD